MTEDQKGDGASSPRAAAAMVVASMLGQRDAGTPDHAVPVWVSREDIHAVYGRKGAEGGRLGDPAYGDAIQLLVKAVRQPVLDESYGPTGEVREGASGVVHLDSKFGNGRHRKLYFGHDALVEVAAAAGVAGVQALALVKDGNAARQRLVDGRKAEVAAVRAAAKARPIER